MFTQIFIKIKTHVGRLITSFSENHAFMWMWGGSRQATECTIRRMCFTCLITKARIQTHTHFKYVILLNTYCFSTATLDKRTRFSVITVYVYRPPCTYPPEYNSPLPGFRQVWLTGEKVFTHRLISLPRQSCYKSGSFLENRNNFLSCPVVFLFLHFPPLPSYLLLLHKLLYFLVPFFLLFLFSFPPLRLIRSQKCILMEGQNIKHR